MYVKRVILTANEKDQGKMNIWMFNHYAATGQIPGGTRHCDFGRELLKRGHNVAIFASGFHLSLHKELKLKNNEKYIVEDCDGVKFVWLKTFHYQKNNFKRVVNMLSYMCRAYWLGKKVTKKVKGIDKPDIIIGSSVHLFAVYAAYLLSKKYKVPFIMEVRDLWPQTLIDMGVSKWHPFVILLGVLEKYLYKRADKIITLLEGSCRYIENFGIEREKIAWIPNGVDLERFHLAETNLKCQQNSGSDFILTYAGAMSKANNLDVVIKAAEILHENHPDIKFLFVGDGQEKERLVQTVKEKKLNNIKFRDPVPKDEIPEILANANGLVFNLEDSPVFKYGISSNKLFDYLASGKPIIFSCKASNNPVQEASAGITVPPNNPEALAEAVLKLYDTPEQEKAEMGRNGREYVRKYHDIPILVDRLQSLLNIEGKTK
jgi:glycosyltransferase involved in cell wall biosynthesis